jgi:hypothetical protein
MKLNEDKVPITLDEAILFLRESFSKTDIKEIKRPGFDGQGLHFTLGMYLRNNWSLWEKDTKLVQWFKKTYNIDHADDISGIILDSCFRDIRKEPRKDKELAKRYIEHWKRTA